jgi:hypothetical protein
MEMFSVFASLLLHRKHELLPCHLKLHTVGDVNLSLSLGIVCECA